MKRLILFLTLVGVCSAAVADTDKVFEQCRAKLKKSQKLDLTCAAELLNGVPVRIVPDFVRDAAHARDTQLLRQLDHARCRLERSVVGLEHGHNHIGVARCAP